MDLKKLILGAVAVTAFIFVIDYLFYGIIMSDFFTVEENQREMPLFLLLIVGIFFFAFPFVHFYPKVAGNTSKASEGFKYGAIIALMVFVPMAFIMHGVYDWNGSTTEMVVDSIFRIVQIGICGIIVAYIYNIPSGIGGRPGKTGGGGDD